MGQLALGSLVKHCKNLSMKKQLFYVCSQVAMFAVLFRHEALENVRKTLWSGKTASIDSVSNNNIDLHRALATHSFTALKWPLTYAKYHIISMPVVAEKTSAKFSATAFLL